MTKLQLSGGEAIRLALELEEIRDALQAALAENRLLELHAPDGKVVVVNPHQVQYLQDDLSNHSSEEEGLPGMALREPAY